MSTMSDIQQLVDKGILFEYEIFDPDPDFEVVRMLYVTQELMNLCPPTGKSRDKDALTGARLDGARALFYDFVGGEKMFEGQEITFLIPPQNQVWEFRLVPKAKNEKHVRFFGWFVDYDVFVITHMQMRDNLGNYGDPRWTKEINKCKEKRKRLCNSLQVLNAGMDITKYLSNSETRVY